MTWELRNDGPSSLAISEAWHPHAGFRSSRLRRDLHVGPRTKAELEMPARTTLRPGERLENGFLILRATSDRGRWRILTRFTVDARVAGPPSLRVQAIDVHPA